MFNMNLEEAFPLAELRARLEANNLGAVKIQKLGFGELHEISQAAPETLHAMALNVWSRINMRKLEPVEPQAIAQHIMANDPKLFRKIEKKIQKKVIHDAFWTQAMIFNDQFPDGFKVAEYLVAQVYPNDLLLGDVYFQNPLSPIPDNPYRFTAFWGFALLPRVIDNLVGVAKERKCDFMTLTAAAADLIPLFQRFGYVVEDNIMARMGLANGMTIPMERKMPNSGSLILP
jgi:hypothetical protein